MSRRSSLPQTRRHVFIFDEDWEFLQEAYGSGSPSKLGTSGAIRQIVHGWVRVKRAQLEAEYDRIAAVPASASASEAQLESADTEIGL